MQAASFRPDWQSLCDLRLASGLVLFAYVTCHFLGLAGGLALIDGMTAASSVTLAVWETLPGTVVLYAALLLHLVFGLGVLARPWRDLASAGRRVRTITGLAIPPALLLHLIDVRGAVWLFGQDVDFEHLVAHYWIDRPVLAIVQLLLMALVWLHGCLGVCDWLRFRRCWPRLRGGLIVAACLVPLMAALGFANAGFDLEGRTAEVAGEATDAAVRARLARLGAVSVGLYVALLAGVLAAGLAVRRRRTASPVAWVEVPDGRTLPVAKGATLLQVLQDRSVPIGAVCGGKARCTTCRVRLSDCSQPQRPAGPLEAAALARIGAPPGTRLACQLKPVGRMQVVPLLRRVEKAGPQPLTFEHMRETEVIAFCSDLRDSTRLADLNLPYDLFDLMSTYQQIVQRSVAAHGGIVISVSGDGIMALFMTDRSPPTAARAALAAAGQALRDLDELSQDWDAQSPAPLRVGIGIHLGAGVVGLAHEEPRLHFFGAAANLAHRLQAGTKDAAGRVLVSRATLQRSGLPHGEAVVRVPAREGEPRVEAVAFDLAEPHGHVLAPLAESANQ